MPFKARRGVLVPAPSRPTNYAVVMLVWYAVCDCIKPPIVRGGGPTIKRFPTQRLRDKWAIDHRHLCGHRVLTFAKDDTEPADYDPLSEILPHDLRNT